MKRDTELRYLALLWRNAMRFKQINTVEMNGAAGVDWQHWVRSALPQRVQLKLQCAV